MRHGHKLLVPFAWGMIRSRLQAAAPGGIPLPRRSNMPVYGIPPKCVKTYLTSREGQDGVRNRFWCWFPRGGGLRHSEPPGRRRRVAWQTKAWSFGGKMRNRERAKCRKYFIPFAISSFRSFVIPPSIDLQFSQLDRPPAWTGRGDQVNPMPPLASMYWPVTHRASSEASHAPRQRYRRPRRDGPAWCDPKPAERRWGSVVRERSNRSLSCRERRR